MRTVPSPILSTAMAAKYAQIVEGLELDSIQVASKSHQSAQRITAKDSPNPYRKCKDGERTEHLTRLAGMWIAERKPLERVVELARGWNNGNEPPLDDDKVRATCESILRTHRRNHPDVNAPRPLTPLFDLTEASVAQMIGTPPPPRKWLVDELLPLGIVGMIVGQGGSSKSMLALQLALAVTSGASFWGRSIPEPGSAILLCAEDDHDELHRRVAAACAQLTDPVVIAAVKARLFIKSLVAENNLMTVAPDRGEVHPTDFVDRFILTVKPIPDLRLIVIDPASRFRGGDENAAQDATRFVEQVERLRAATGATVIILHHANKGAANADEPSQIASRGSSALTDGVRWQMNLNKPTRGKDGQAKRFGIDDAQRHHFVVATITKNNYGPPHDEVLLRRGDYGLLNPISIGAAHDPLIEMIELIRSESAAGRQYSRDAFERRFGGKTGPLKCAYGLLRVRIKTAMKDGRLTYVDGKLDAGRA